MSVTPRASGAIVVELRRNGAVAARARGRGTSGTSSTLRLRSALRAGRYAIRVRAARGASVVGALHVR